MSGALVWREAWAGLQRRRLATLLAASGLVLSLTTALLTALVALALADTDPAIPEPERVVLLDFRSTVPQMATPWLTAAPLAFGPMLQARHLPLGPIARTAVGGLSVLHQGRVMPVYLQLADAELVPLLGLRAEAGDLAATLRRRDAVALSRGLLRKLWGELPSAQALGRTLTAKGQVYTVTAVYPDADPRSPLAARGTFSTVGTATAMVGFDSPAREISDDELDALVTANGRVYARLQPSAQVEQVAGWMRDAFLAHPRYQQLPAEWRAGREPAQFRGLPLTALPFAGEPNAERWQLVGVVGAAAGVLLLLAAFNQMNLTTAQLLQRQRETALRRSQGATGAQLLQLWALEALLPLLASAALAALLAWWMAPAVAAWMGIPPGQPVADPMPAPALAGLAGTVLLLWPLTLALPAAVALRRPPAPALQGRTASEGPWGRRVRQTLLGVQFGGALVLLALAGVLAAQQRHLMAADQGFDLHDRMWLGVMVGPNDVPNLDAFAAALSRHPAVLHWAYSDARPAADAQGRTELVQRLGVAPPAAAASAAGAPAGQVLRMTTVSPGFFATWGMRVLAGQARVGGGETTVVIDAKAARGLGFARPQDAVGALLTGGGDLLQPGTAQRRVVAVVADVKLESAVDDARPQGFLLSDQPQWDLSIHGRDLATLRTVLQDLWKAHGPPLMIELASAEEQRASLYQLPARLTVALTALSALAVGVAMLGAYSLVADTLRRRRTELVLRRLHGAGPADMARAAAGELAVPLAVATVLGAVLAAAAGMLYLDSFVDAVDPLSGLALPLVAAVLLSLLVTALAVLRHLRLAWRLQPAQALQ